MTTDSIQSALNAMGGDSPTSTSTAAVKQFAKLAESEYPLQVYLERLLPAAVGLFQGKAGMVWLRAHAATATSACFALRYRMDSTDWDEKTLQKHDRILQLAWQQRQPMLVEPQPKKKSGLEGHIDSPILFGPIVHLNEPLAVVEILLLPRNPLTASQRRAALRAMQWVMDSIHSGLQRRLRLPSASLTQANQAIGQLEKEIESYQRSIERSIEARLRQFQGWTFGSLGDNQQFAKRIHRLLDEHGLRVRCPECGNASILRCLNSGNSKNGVFVFDHYLEGGRTFHGGPTTFPAITVIPKPARRIGLSAS